MDIIGAAWYVHPVLHERMRLATPDDAWQVLRTGILVPSAVIDGILANSASAVPEPTGNHSIAGIESADVVVLDDGAKVRLIGVDVPSNPDLQEKAMSRIRAVTDANSCDVQNDAMDEATDGTKLRWLVCGEINLNTDLVRNGLAFHNVGVPNMKYAEQMVVAGLDAMRLKRGFWDK